MSWLRKNWRTIAGAVCGAAAPVVAIAVNPIAGVALGAVCTAAFGREAMKKAEPFGDALGKAVARELEKREGKK